MRLARHLARRISLVSAACLLLFFVLALVYAIHNIRAETGGSRQTQRLAAELARLQTADAAGAAAVLRDLDALARGGELRHLHVEITDAAGRSLLTPPGGATEADMLRPVARLLGALLSALQIDVADGMQSWVIVRPDGQRWTVRLRPNPDSEQAEAAGYLGILLAMLACLALALSASAGWVLRAALRPVDGMVAMLDRLGRGEHKQPLDVSGIDEVDQIQRAIHALGRTLAEAEQARQQLSARLLSLQEDERTRLARELHDEIGQQLTAIRLNAHYLSQSAIGGDEERAAIADIGAAASNIQDEIRSLLQRLQPQGFDEALDAPRFVALIEALIDGWQRLPGQTVRYDLVHDLPAAEAARVAPPVWLALYRLTQEALTNIARHAQASTADIRVSLEGGVLHWRVRDNGRGLPGDAGALVAGNGIAGMRERVWALGGDFRLGGAPGVTLEARIALPAGVDCAHPDAHPNTHLDAHSDA